MIKVSMTATVIHLKYNMIVGGRSSEGAHGPPMSQSHTPSLRTALQYVSLPVHTYSPSPGACSGVNHVAVE
jgi:hypothetical protein